MNIYKIIDPVDGQDYDIELLPHEVKRYENDMTFANQKLEEAKDAAMSSMEDEENEVKENKSLSTVQLNNFDLNVMFKWPHEAILLLIEEYSIRRNDFTSGKISQKKIWDAISKKLIEKGHVVNGPQCISKFAGLKSTYKATKDHNTESGNNTRSWIYYDLMNDLLGQKPFIQPVATTSSIGLNFITCKRSLSPSQSSDSSSQEGTSKRSKNQPANKNILLEIQKSKQLTEENRERRHQEKMKQRDEAIDIMRQIVLSLNK